MGPFTQKDDEEAYGKAGPLREGNTPSLREPRYGRFLCSLHREGRRKAPYGQTAYGGALLRRRPLTGTPSLMGEWVPSQSRTKRLTGRLFSYGKGGLTGRLLTGIPHPYGSLITGGSYGSLHREGRRKGLREGWALTKASYRPFKRPFRPCPYGQTALGGCPYDGKAPKEEASYGNTPALREPHS